MVVHKYSQPLHVWDMNYFSVGTVFRRQNLSIDDRFWRINTVAALQLLSLLGNKLSGTASGRSNQMENELTGLWSLKSNSAVSAVKGERLRGQSPDPQWQVGGYQWLINYPPPPPPRYESHLCSSQIAALWLKEIYISSNHRAAIWVSEIVTGVCL